jgi:hypothetical protein
MRQSSMSSTMRQAGEVSQIRSAASRPFSLSGQSVGSPNHGEKGARLEGSR